MKNEKMASVVIKSVDYFSHPTRGAIIQIRFQEINGAGQFGPVMVGETTAEKLLKLMVED